MLGLTDDVTLHAMRVMGCNGAWDELMILNTVDWVYSNMQRPAVISMSLGLDVI